MLSAVAAPSCSEKLKTVRRALRAVHGSAGHTPSPAILNYADVGLLYFLNQKQAQLHEALGALGTGDSSDLRPLHDMVEFVRFVVGGLIVEAERVDAAVVAVKKEVARVSADLRNVDAEIQYLRPRLGSSVEQAIAQHYRGRLTVPQRGAALALDGVGTVEQSQLGELPQAVVSLRAQLRHLDSHLRALRVVQRLIHGSGLRIPEVEAAAVIAELDVVTTFRKAAHKVRDATFDLPGREDLVAVASTLDFFEMLCSGVVAASDAIQELENFLKKERSKQRSTSSIRSLDTVDARNKLMSSEALHLNDVTVDQYFSRNPAAIVSQRATSVLPEAPQEPNSLDDFLSQYCA